MKNITRIQAHNELGSRRSRNIVMIASTMLINRISVTRVVAIETASPKRDSHLTRSPAHPVAPKAAKPGLITSSISRSRTSNG